MVIKNFAILSAPTVTAYSHLGGKIGVLVGLNQEAKSDLGYELAMQIAAASPKYLKPEEVKADDLEKEKEIYKDQLLKEGKPEAMIDKIVEGKMGKYYSEVCLLEQEYIKDDKKKIKDILGDSTVTQFIRFTLSN